MKKKLLLLFVCVCAIAGAYAQKKTAAIDPTAVKITIDGTVDAAWATVSQNDIARPFKNDVFDNDDDLSGYWKAVYADSGLMVLVVTSKDNIRYTGIAVDTFGAGHEKDGFELYFDVSKELMDGGKAGGWPAPTPGHYQFAVYNVDAPAAPAWCKGCKISINAADTTTGVNYPITSEIYIPWKALLDKNSVPYSTRYTDPLGFDVYLIDNDGPFSGKAKRRRLTWSNMGSVAENYNNMDSAGTMTFTGFKKKTATLDKPASAITIDGTIDAAWASATQQDIATPFKGDAFDNADDLSGYWKAAMTDTGLFVLVNTTKDNKRYTGWYKNNKFGAGHEKDGLEVYFDMNAFKTDDAGKPGGWPATPGHYQFPIYNVDSAIALPSWCKGCKVSVKANDTTTGVNYPVITEMYIPWKALATNDKSFYSPRMGLPIGFDVYLIDNDGQASGKPARRRMVWSNSGLINEDYNNMDDAGLIKWSGFAKNTAEVTKASSKITIDGTAENAWNSAKQYNITRPFGTDVFANADDLSGFWKALVADSGVFVYVNTTKDNIRYASGSVGQNYEKDGFEVYFDTNVDSLMNGGNTNGTSNKGHYQIPCYNVLSATLPQWCTGCKMVVKADTVLTNYPVRAEMYVPWTALLNRNGKLPKIDGSKPIGFDVYLLDNDGVTPARRRLTWSNNGSLAENYANTTDEGFMFVPALNISAKVKTITVAGAAGKTNIDSVGKTLQMVATLNPTYASNDTVVWSLAGAADSALATISNKGLLTAKGLGTVKVIAKSKESALIADTAEITIGTTPIVNLKSGSVANVSIYPNPVDSKLNISTDAQITRITVYNMFGQQMLTFSENMNSIDVAKLKSGNYIISISTKNGNAVRNFIKK